MNIIDSYDQTEHCLGNVRWVPLSGTHRRKLQQLFQVTRYKNGEVARVDVEWRDVPEE